MMVQIIGFGCIKCNRLADLIRKAIDEIGLPRSLEKVAEMSRMLEFGAKALPALAIDGLVVIAGHLPTLNEIKQLLIRPAEFAPTEGGWNSLSSRSFHTASVRVVGGNEATS